MTCCTLFVIDLASRRIQIVGSTPYPDAQFMRQVGRTLTAAEDGLLRDHRVLIYDRDRKWSHHVRQLLEDEGIRVVQTPYQAPNANAHAERFVRSIKEDVSIGSYRSASATFDEPSQSSWLTIITSGIIKGGQRAYR